MVHRVAGPAVEKKGKKDDNNMWRGVTLVSVGTKPLARVASERAARWSEVWQRED